MRRSSFGTCSIACARCSCRGSARRRRCTPSSIRCRWQRSEEHTSELQSLAYLVCRLLLEKKKKENMVSRMCVYDRADIVCWVHYVRIVGDHSGCEMRVLAAVRDVMHLIYSAYMHRCMSAR